jgi:hypothetical protein
MSVNHEQRIIQKMSLQLVLTLESPDEVNRVVQALAAAGLLTSVAGAAARPAMPAMPAAPGARPTALPAGGPAGGAPPPPPQPAAIQAPANPRLDNVIRLMDAYSKAGHKIEGVRKVLGMVNLQRAQDANEEQMIWLEQAFANTAWAP